jgi:hypothetical protein
MILADLISLVEVLCEIDKPISTGNGAAVLTDCDGRRLLKNQLRQPGLLLLLCLRPDSRLLCNAGTVPCVFTVHTVALIKLLSTQ